MFLFPWPLGSGILQRFDISSVVVRNIHIEITYLLPTFWTRWQQFCRIPNTKIYLKTADSLVFGSKVLNTLDYRDETVPQKLLLNFLKFDTTWVSFLNAVLLICIVVQRYKQIRVIFRTVELIIGLLLKDYSNSSAIFFIFFFSLSIFASVHSLKTNLF